MKNLKTVFVTCGMEGFGLYFGKGHTLKEANDNYKSVSHKKPSKSTMSAVIFSETLQFEDVTVDDCLMIHYPTDADSIALK